MKKTKRKKSRSKVDRIANDMIKIGVGIILIALAVGLSFVIGTLISILVHLI